jgi:predicted XRE-type DNA-binding protein
MATYSRVWDALSTSEAEADELQARSEQLHALQKQIAGYGWTPQETADRLGLSPARADQLIAGDINEFTLDELQQLTHTAAKATPPPAH